MHIDYAENIMRTNTDAFVRAITDGEMKVRDMVSSLINQTALATSEDLRWGILWPVLVSVRGPDNRLYTQWWAKFRINFHAMVLSKGGMPVSVQGLACQQYAGRGTS